MFKKILKVVAFFLLFIFIAIIISLVVDEWQYQKERREAVVEIRTVELERAENYLLVETPEGRKVVNENVGLSFLVPEGWNVELFSEGEDHQGVGLSSPDMEAGNVFPVKGCLFDVVVEKYVQKFPDRGWGPDFIQKQIRGEAEITNSLQEIVIFGNRGALRTTNETIAGNVTSVKFSKDNKIFFFGAMLALEEKDRCTREFDNFLSSVIIK